MTALKTSRGRFRSEEDHSAMARLLDEWGDDPVNVKPAFLRLAERLSEKEEAQFTFKSRPGISYSLRAILTRPGPTQGRIFAMVDIIDDDPGHRWLSTCFYGDTITDPEDRGDFVPGGLLGEDGCCFDLYQYDEAVISYLERRIDEAYEN